MTGIKTAYRELLVSPVQLTHCTQATSVAQLVALLKQCWHEEILDDEDFLAGLNACNEQVLDLHVRELAGRWMPYHYHAKTRAISWCLPQGRATEPFFDQFIGRCRQRLAANQLLRPKTPLMQVLDKPYAAAGSPPPSGFIFHVSRCGSTLVSGCLAECERSGVLSESPLLTEVLLDPGLTANERRQCLPVLVDLQARGLPAPDAVIIKWNAWDVFHWPLIRALYPEVPVLLLIRDPVEVLASHQRLAGRHMAGDPSLAGLNPVFAGMNPDESILDFRVRVLHSLLEAMSGICEQPGVMVVDYAQLGMEKIAAINLHFGITASDDEYGRIRRRMKFHSKELNRNFQADEFEKQRQFSQSECDEINRRLSPLYRKLLMFTRARPENM